MYVRWFKHVYICACVRAFSRVCACARVMFPTTLFAYVCAFRVKFGIRYYDTLQNYTKYDKALRLC